MAFSRFEVTAVQRFPKAEQLVRKLNYGIALGLTRTAQSAQKAVLQTLHRSGNFTIRNHWTDPKTRYGIKITAARIQRLESEVRTAADWLVMHEKGVTKTPTSRGSSRATMMLNQLTTVTRGKNKGKVRQSVGRKRAKALNMTRSSLAVPTKTVRPSKRSIIRGGQRPRRLEDSFRGVVTINGKNVFGLWQRFGKSIRLAYRLIDRARIRKVPTFFTPIQRVINRQRTELIQEEIMKVMRELR